ncbi:glutaminase A [Anianabacter salinae]|uniref:glutaminase A n=1 Tax=Anianabacter salinae TaxID=2851023 RepID=UPI00225DE4AD|nr:glutaminase A [Anianabacter salinae]MBV0911372.1 glutaminase A [Anianabacter salinae]
MSSSIPAFEAGTSAADGPISRYLDALHDRLLPLRDGEIATYIPELSTADPDAFGIAIATVDGHLYTSGAAGHPFTIQSMSKPFTYGYALRSCGVARVLEQVGVEPTGEAFNSIILDNVNNRPFNPMVNAGAIAVSELMPGDTPEARLAMMMDFFNDLAGRRLDIDEAVFASERDTGHRNRAIAYMMLNSGMITSPPEDVLELYFKQCSINVTCADMAMMAATLANHGTQPVTGRKILDPDQIRDMLTLMSTCGMYDYAGQWAYEVGLPAKSGVAGGIFAVIPGQAGIAVYSPPLDQVGNSIRGVAVCKEISRDFGLHAFSDRTMVQTVIRREYRASEVRSKRLRSVAEIAVLAREGHRIAVLEVQGALFFGSAERLIRRLAALAEDCMAIVIDFKRCSDADPAALRLIEEAVARFGEAGPDLVVTHVPGDHPLRALLPGGARGTGRVLTLPDTDTALEELENDLLSGFFETDDLARFALKRIDLFHGLDEGCIKALEGAVSSFQFSAGQQVIREGDDANAFFVVASGAASISVTLPGGQRKRVASVGPGQSFGEMALIDGGKRTADVHADSAMICYAFSVDRIREIAKARPEVLTTILQNLVISLTTRLRMANDEIRNLV